MEVKYKKGGELNDHEETYKKWKSLVNMSKSELENFYNSEEGKKAGLSSSEAKSLGIHSGRESARWIMKMKDTPKSEWTPTMWKWAKRQISFISRMTGNKGGLYDDKGNKTRKHTSLLIWGHNPEKHKSGGTISQTPAPKEDKIYGSKVNVKGSSKDTKSAKEIKFDAKTLLSISNKVKEHNKQHPDKKVTLATAKAVVRRGMGAYSSTHRPTISGGKPNSRVAWGLARLNAFMYKIVHGKSKSGKYSQDDDLINELGYKVKSYANGGEISDVKSFYDWFCDWYKNGVCKKMNIMISVPNQISGLKPIKVDEDNAMILDLFEKTDLSIDAKKYMSEIVDKADQYGVTLYLQPNPRYKYIKDDNYQKKITRQYLIKYYEMFGFELMPDNEFMKRLPNLYADGGEPNKYKTIAAFEDFTVKIYDGKLGYKDLLKLTGEMPKNIEHIEVVYNDTDFGDFYEYSKKEVSKMFGSEFEEGYPIVNFLRNGNEIQIQKAVGILQNGEKVYYDKEKLEWCIIFERGGQQKNITLTKDSKNMSNNEIVSNKGSLGKNGEKGGIFKGDRHSAPSGGIPVKVEGGGNVLVEDSEPIIVPEAVNADVLVTFDGEKMKPKDVISKINTDYGGVPIKEKGGNVDEPITVKAGSVVVTRNAALDEETKHEYNGKMLTNKEILSRINHDIGGGVEFAEGGEIKTDCGCQHEKGGKVTSKQMQEFELLKQKAKKELIGFESEKSEHETTLENLEENKINVDEAISQIVESHLKENPNYYSEQGCNISETKKRLVDGGEIEAKQKAEEYWNSLSQEDKDKILNEFGNAVNDLKSKYKQDVIDLETKKSELVNRRKEIYEEEKAINVNSQSAVNSMDLFKERQGISFQLKELDLRIQHAKNIEKAFSNGGTIVEFEDKKGNLNTNIPSFLKVDTSVISFNEETILADEMPKYIPYINESVFRIKGFVFDAIRIDRDTYIVATNGYRETNKDELSYNEIKAGQEIHPSSELQGYVLVTLDQLVLINDYYITKQKAIYQKEAEEKTKRQEDYYDKLPIAQRESFLNQKGYYHSLPVAVKKKITQLEYEALDLAGKEALYKPFKRYNAERLKSKLEENYMWVSFHNMYERFLDPTAVAPQPRYANAIVFEYWRKFRDMMSFKIKDIKMQREVDNEQYKKALETSFGDVNTNDSLFAQYGILVKRQDGKTIEPTQINQIQQGWVKVQKCFGSLTNLAKEQGLKISHTNTTNVFASKAIGVFVPSMKTIAVSAKYGNEQFDNTFAHEVAHFIDSYLGGKNGKRWATDDYESTAGTLAFEFRRLLNKKSDSDYINATKECFARALQQYFAISTFGDEAQLNFSESPLDKLTYYFLLDNFVSKDNYYNIIKPMVEKFLNETGFEIFVDEQKSEVTQPIEETVIETTPIVNSLEQQSEQRINEYLESKKEEIETTNELSEIDNIQDPTKRLSILRESLRKKEELFNQKMQEHFDTVKQANGQPLNDKRNGQATLNKWERQNETLRNIQKEIEKTKNAIEVEEGKIKQVSATKEYLPKQILDAIDSGLIVQWRKHPNTFFVAGVDKGRLVWDDKAKVLAHKYAREITDKDQYKKFAKTYNELFNAIKNNVDAKLETEQPKETIPNVEEIKPFEQFEKIVLESNTLEEAFNKVREIKNVPYDVSVKFRETYDPNDDLTPIQAFERFYNEVKSRTYKIGDEFLLGNKKVFIGESGAFGLKDEVCLYNSTDKTLIKCISKNSFETYLEEGRIEPIEKTKNGFINADLDKAFEKLKDWQIQRANKDFSNKETNEYYINIPQYDNEGGQGSVYTYSNPIDREKDFELLKSKYIPQKVIDAFETETKENNFSFVNIDKQIWRRDNKTGEITNIGVAPDFTIPKTDLKVKNETKSIKIKIKALQILADMGDESAIKKIKALKLLL